MTSAGNPVPHLHRPALRRLEEIYEVGTEKVYNPVNQSKRVNDWSYARCHCSGLTRSGDVHSAGGYGLVQIDVAIADFKVEAALRVNANPSFIMNGGALSPVVG